MIEHQPLNNFWNSTVEKKYIFIVFVYLILVTIMEFISFYGNVVYGSLGNALLIFIAINHAVWANKTILQRVLPAVALLPFLRLLSVGLPVPGWPPQAAYILVSVPLLATVGMIIYHSGISLMSLGFHGSTLKSQLLIAISGIPLGFIGYIILQPPPLFPIVSPMSWFINLIVIFVFIVFAEEIVFRFIFLFALEQVSEVFAPVMSGVFYGVFCVGSNSFIYAVFMGLVGYLFAVLVIRTRSLWGVLIAHLFLVVGMGLVFPMIF